VRRAVSDFIQPFAGMTRIGAAKFRERAEEMVVAAVAFGRDEVAHGEGIDQPVV
jgi:hypothetical protein